MTAPLFPPLPNPPPLDTRWKVRPDAFDPGPTLAEVVSAQGATRHPIGLNVRQDVNYADVLAYVKQQGGLRTCLFHCDKSILPRLHDFTAHVDMLIWRPRPNSGETWAGERLYKDFAPLEYIDRCLSDIRAAGFDPRQVWIHLHNESEWNAQMIEWERSAIVYAISKGAKVVALNPGVGTPLQAALSMGRTVVYLAGHHPEHVLIGLHEYFSVYGTRKDPWYLERWQFWETYRIAEGLPAVRYVVTEFGSEDIADDYLYTQALPRTGDRPHVGPVKANERAWSATYHNPAHHVDPKPYPGLDAAYAEQIATAIDVGQYLDPRIAGACLFSWGSDGGKWADYDVSDMSALHALLAKWWKDEQVTVPPVIPPPVEIALKPAYDALLVESTNLRTESTPDNRKSKIVGTVKVEPGKDTVVRVQEPIEPVTNDSQDGAFIVYTWFRVTAPLPGFAEPVTGWMAHHRTDLFKRLEPEPVPEPEPEPPPPAEPVYVTLAVMNAAIKAAVDASEMRTVDFYNAKLDALTAKLTAQDARLAALEAQTATMPQRTIQEVTRRLLETEASQQLSKAS